MTTTPQTTNLTIRIDKQLKADAESLFDDLGLNLTTAINIFLKKCLREDRVPFELSRQENLGKATVDAILETECLLANRKSAEGFTNIRDLINSLEA